MKLNKISLLIKSMFLYLNGQIFTRHIVVILRNCITKEVDTILLDQIQEIIEQFINKMIKQPAKHLQIIKLSFFKIHCHLNFTENFITKFGDAKLFINQMTQFFKIRLQTRPLAHGTKSNDLFCLKSLNLMLNFFQAKHDCFSYYDFPYIVEQLSCQKKDIFKLWHNAIKHVLVQLNGISVEEAK